MKTLFQPIQLLIAICLIVTLFSCKDKDLNITAKQLSGTWEVTSWKNDSIQWLIPSQCISFTMNYEFSEETDGGDFRWDRAFYGGSSTYRKGTYQIDEEGKNFSINYVEDGNLPELFREYNFRLDDNSLELSTVVSGTNVFIKAKRK